MTLRVVFYAEGSAERAGEISLVPAPGATLSAEHLGPVHLLIHRALTDQRVPQGAVRFEAPLRVRGRTAKGSDLYSEGTLRQLLRWARPDLRPDLVVVMVDTDDELGRVRRLEAATTNIGVQRIVAGAVREFEAWLIADTRALRQTFGLDISTTRDPESMPCGEAKRQLADWTATRVRMGVAGESSQTLRRALASTCDLSEVTRRCASFAELLRKLRQEPLVPQT
jgi:hypothetical protein